jgi:hypothetical protein
VEVVGRLDKIKMIAAFRSLFPYMSTIWQGDVHGAYFDGHMVGSRHALNRSGKAGEPPGWESDEEEAERNADPTIDEDLKKWTGEGRYARLEGNLEEMERELVGEALTAWLGFAGFCAQEVGLEAEKLLEAGGAREAIRRESAGARGAERTPRGGARRGRRGRVPGHDDGGVAPRIGKRVGANTSRGWISRARQRREVRFWVLARFEC